MVAYNPDATYVASRNDRVGIGDGNYELVAGEPMPDDWPDEVKEAIVAGVGLVEQQVETDEAGNEKPTINPNVHYEAVRNEVFGIGDLNLSVTAGQVLDDIDPEILEVLIRNEHVKEVPKTEEELAEEAPKRSSKKAAKAAAEEAEG